MRKAAILLAFGILCSFIIYNAELSVSTFASAESSAFALSDRDKLYLDSIKDTPISLAITSELMSFTNSKGEKSGILQPLIGLMEEQWGLTVTTVNSGLEEGFQKLSTGEVDMLGLAILNEGRTNIYHHTEMLFNPTMDIYTYRDTPLDSVVDLRGQTVGFISDSVLPELLEVYLTQEGSIRYYKTSEEMIRALERGEVFCIATTMMIQGDLLEHPDINYKMSVESVIAPQGIYAGSERIAPLIDLINRYIRSDEGGEMLAEIDANRYTSTIEKYAAFFKDDIADIRANYDTLRMFDGGMMYPLSYIQNGEYKGLQKEIYDAMQELTGLPVELLNFSDYENAGYTVADSLKNGEILSAACIYRSSEFDFDPAFDYSAPLMTDMLSIYVKQDNKLSSLSEMRIGSHDYSIPYLHLNIAAEQEPAIYTSLSDMMRDLNDDKLDAVFIGEMMTDYYYTVLDDYTVKRFNNPVVPASVHVLYNTKNTSFNRLMNAVIKMQMAATPSNSRTWNSRSQNSKFEMMWLRSQMDEYRSNTLVTAVVFVAVLTLILVFALYQIFKFRNFNKQISGMLSVQGNADMLWGNLKTGRIVSKGNDPISKKLGLSKEVSNRLIDLGQLKNDLGEIDGRGLKYYMRDIEIKPENSDSIYYFRRFAHKINDYEFMVYIMDFTAEKYREQELSKLANTDHLTNLLNRRAMDELMMRKSEEYANVSKTAFVFMLDIDNFKKVNDSYGHNVGDRALVALAKIIESHTDGGLVARWGGEEFLCVSEQENAKAAMELAWKILYEFESAEITVGKTTSFSCTVSCGVSALADGEPYLNAVTRADKALYQAKYDGKNCVRYIEAGASPDTVPVASEAVGVSVTYDRVMSRLVQAFFHIRNTDSVIMELLKVITTYNALDRAYIFEKAESGAFERTYVYDPQDLASPSTLHVLTIEDWTRFGNFDMLNFDSASQNGNLDMSKSRFVSDASTLMEEELSKRARGLRSFAQLPIFAGGELIGMVGFDNCCETHEWTNDERRVLCDAAAIIGEFVVRKKLEKKLVTSNSAMTEILESMDDIVYVVDFETQILLFANKQARTFIPGEFINKKPCWEVLRPDLGGMCDFCMHKYLVNENGEPTGKTMRQEVFNPVASMWFDASYTLIEWENGRRAVVMVCRDITAQKHEDMQLEQTLSALNEKKAMLDFAFKGSQSYLWTLSADFKTIDFGDTVESALGYPAEYFGGSFEKYKQLVESEDIEAMLSNLYKCVSGETSGFMNEHRIRAADGAVKWILVRGECYHDDTPMLGGVAIDITERKMLEEMQENLLDDLKNEREKQKQLLEALQSQELKTTLALEAAGSYSWEYTPATDKLVLSKTAEQALGYEIEYFEQKHSKYMECIVFSYVADTEKALQAYINGETEIFTSEYPINTANGEIKWYLTRGRYEGENRDVIYGACIDITASKMHEQMLADRAYRDDMTGMFNKQYISDGLMKPIHEDFKNFGGMLLDVRSFKNINEAFGYSYGDKIIEQIAIKLMGIFSGKQMVRTSGNRFLAVFENTDEKIMERYAKRVVEDFKQPIEIDGQIISVDFRIGIAISTDNDATKLLESTEIALYSAKESMTNDYCVLSNPISAAFKKKVNMELELRNAIKRKEFVLHFQPVMDTATGRIAGAEALIRWEHPQLGLVPPLDFIPLAEETGLIVPIGEYVIDEVAKQLRKWLNSGLDIFLAFNLSARQFLSPHLKSKMQDALKKHRIPKHRIVVEITESAMISDVEYVINILEEFKDLGVGISLDDFGTGYSSMNYLGKIPLSHLKIDRSFVENITTMERDRAILESIVTMSRALGFRVTAEGVETAEQFAIIKELGCDIVQGYYLSKPLTKNKFETFVKSYGSGSGVARE